MPCFAPSEFLITPTASAFGAIAESIIAGDYLQDVGRTSFFPASALDFQDIGVGFGNTVLYIAFLKSRHPSLSIIALAALSAGGLVKIPDLMTSDAPTRTEFYEIKPNSITGRAAGTVKIAMIDALMVAHSLPYVPGTKFTPNKKIMLFSGTPLGAKLDVFFHFQRIAPALIVYDICAEGDLAKLGLAALLAILAIIIAILIRRGLPGGLPGPIPVPALA